MTELKEYTKEEVAKHNSTTNAWIIIKGQIFDVTKFLEEHPGGDSVLMEYAGQDATSAFEDVGHSGDAQQMLANYRIGKLVGAQVPTNPPTKAGANAKPGEKENCRVC
eukprot:TRINITY_DN1274_c0_g1_i1.p2 TRINITY_DN1274_c0_g1~~TRINITY_DN1274_c0_g1_i1.p2  ORF type:complete len:108 (+),score=22.37 TRINITY_DN1274_c0_g1_i1:130-453(+)